jgi:hypothetical protein
LFDIAGGWEGLRIVIAVDLVLGPLLTLVVYKAGKSSLTFDLSCIAIFQIACLGGGVWLFIMKGRWCWQLSMIRYLA